ncbi:MAG: 16S rRNA (uracil(1498)-N(3))-methyltransferase [Butyricicoccus sp.]
MPRFFISNADIQGQTVTITGNNAEHIRVLRMKPGEELTVCDGQGSSYLCRICSSSGDTVTAEIVEAVSDSAEPSVSCTILAGFPKGERADYIIQKCTECGAAEIVFFLSKRCVARPDAKGMQKKLIRFQKIAESAAKQSGRGIIPHVSAVPSLMDALQLAQQTDLPLFLYETGERVRLRDVIEGAGDIHSAAIITGPEGGFDPSEVEQVKAHGIQPVAMGPRILRCETAPVAALTALMYATDNL